MIQREGDALAQRVNVGARGMRERVAGDFDLHHPFEIFGRDFGLEPLDQRFEVGQSHFYLEGSAG
jgi:hypothetical protein